MEQFMVLNYFRSNIDLTRLIYNNEEFLQREAIGFLEEKDGKV
jgi:hypothetical protein